MLHLARRRAIDEQTRVPEDVFDSLLEAGRQARRRGQHRRVQDRRGVVRLHLSASSDAQRSNADLSKTRRRLVRFGGPSAPPALASLLPLAPRARLGSQPPMRAKPAPYFKISDSLCETVAMLFGR